MNKMTVECVKCNRIMRQVEVRADNTFVFSCSCGMLVSLRQQGEVPQPVDWELCDVPTVARASLERRADDYRYLAGYDAGKVPPRIPTAGLPRWKPKRVPTPDVELEGGD